VKRDRHRVNQEDLKMLNYKNFDHVRMVVVFSAIFAMAQWVFPELQGWALVALVLAGHHTVIGWCLGRYITSKDTVVMLACSHTAVCASVFLLYAETPWAWFTNIVGFIVVSEVLTYVTHAVSFIPKRFENEQR
jgi:Na+(H+)/acetate symporter ActP